MDDLNCVSSKNRRFSIRLKLLFIFGLLISIAVFSLSILAFSITNKAVMEKIEAHLVDKAKDTAEILTGRITAFFQFAEGIARSHTLIDSSVSTLEKAKFLEKEASFNKDIKLLALVDKGGRCLLANGNVLQVKDRNWFKLSMNGEKYISEPYVSKADSSLVITVSVPVYDNNRNIIGVLVCDISGMWLSEKIKDVMVGKSGDCYVIDDNGVTVADPDVEVVRSGESSIERAKKDASYASIAIFEKRAITEKMQELVIFTGIKLLIWHLLPKWI